MKRYDLIAHYRGMESWQEIAECDDGDYVQHTDHLAALQQREQQHEAQVATLVDEKCKLAALLEDAREDVKRLDWLQNNYQEIERMGGKWWSVNIEDWSPTLRAAITQAMTGGADHLAALHQLSQEREDVKRLDWHPIETLDKTKMDFVLVCGDGAVRLLLWNPRGHWEAAPPHFGPIQPDVELTHWMPCPDAITQAMTGGAE